MPNNDKQNNENLIDRNALIGKIGNAIHCVRVVGTVAFNLPINELRSKWEEKILDGSSNLVKENNNFHLEFISESESALTYSSLISSNKEASGEKRSYELGQFLNIQTEPQNNFKQYLTHKIKLSIRQYYASDEFNKIFKEYWEKNEDVTKDNKDLNDIRQKKLKQAINDVYSKHKNTKSKSKNDGNKTVEDIKKEIFEKFEANEIENLEENLKIKTCYLPIHIPFIQIDNEYYITYALTKFNDAERFEKIDENHIWSQEFKKYFDAYLDNPLGAQKYCTELTNKGNKLEVIQMYNSKREPLGQLPRDSFLDNTKIKLVVWGFIFTRDGKLIIHRRGDNAKDNRGMWDKSVGGHVALDDVDTVKAASRELAEELFKVEQEGQGGYGQQDFLQTNENKMIFLGEWNPNMRYTMPFNDVSRFENEYYFFRINYSLSKKVITSSRVLPDNNKPQDVKVFVDFYVCIASENIKINDLQNSKYDVKELYEIKDSYKKNDSNFQVTPDLKFIIESEELWEIDLTSFAEYLKSNYNNK